MLKVLLLLLVAVIAYKLFISQRGYRSRTDETPRRVDSERVVPCAYCSLQVPESEAVKVSGRCYCCDEHRTLDGS